jgi:tyrosyl-tRNA synthetase
MTTNIKNLQYLEEAKRVIKSGGVYVNAKKMDDIQYCLSEKDLQEGRVLVIRIGKSNYFILEASETQEQQKIK